jgi:hypothetical protein
LNICEEKREPLNICDEKLDLLNICDEKLDLLNICDEKPDLLNQCLANKYVHSTAITSLVWLKIIPQDGGKSNYRNN